MLSHPRGRLPRMVFGPMKCYTFGGVLGAMGSLFEKKCVFIKILQKCRKGDKSRIFQFSSEKVKIREIHDIAETPIIPKEYQGFGASRFTKSSISRNPIIFMQSHFSLNIQKFHGFFTFSTSLKNFNENALFLKKRAHGAQDPPKCIVFHWFKQHSRQPAARVRKHDFSEKSEKLFPRSPRKNENSMEIMKFSRIS